MFNFFKKKKISKRDDQFVTDLASFSSAIRYSVNFITDEVSKHYSKEVLDIYLDGTFQTSNYSASDSYLNELILNSLQATYDGHMDPIMSVGCYTEVDDFLKFHHQYNSEIVIKCMDLWYEVLVKVGAFEQ